MMALWLIFMCCVYTSSNVCAVNITADDHRYFRPSKSEVSGFPPPNFAANHRSPCPGLNSLANHGYLPRNGKFLTPKLIRNTIVDVFNIDMTLAERLTRLLPKQLTLADLSIPGFIEHDASLVHDDSYFKKDPAHINATLVDKLIGKCNNNKLDKRSLAAARRERETECKKENPKYALPIKMHIAAYGEAALLLLAMGNDESETISSEYAKSFLMDEKIPDDFQRSNKAINTMATLYLAAQINLLAVLDYSERN